ncbi:Mu transposase domain-containing protein, partial [Bifidobacterium pullorum]
HHRIEVRFCNPSSGWEKGSVENAVGFLRRNLMVPPPNAESHRQLTRHLLSGCDAIADVDHYRSGRTIRDMFADDLEDMLPLPRARFDAVEWVERRADREGNVEIDSNRYLAGPSWRGWTLQVGLRAFDVEIRTRDGRKVNTLPRVYGRCGRTVRNPACLLPALARKPRAWGESPIRGDFPGKLRLRIDAMDSGDRQRTLRLIARASDASGFKAATAAAEHLVEQGHGIDEASLMTLARRIA